MVWGGYVGVEMGCGGCSVDGDLWWVWWSDIDDDDGGGYDLNGLVVVVGDGVYMKDGSC